MSKPTASGEYLLPSEFCPVALQTAGVDPLGHVSPGAMLNPWLTVGGKLWLFSSMGKLRGLISPQFLSVLPQEERGGWSAPRKKRASVWGGEEHAFLLTIHVTRVVSWSSFFSFYSWRDLLWQIHRIHLPSRGDLRAPQGLHDLGLYLHWSWTWENQLHHCQYVTKSLLLELTPCCHIFQSHFHNSSSAY